ncbi:DinB family protein [Mucilaginibacter celer]|uniref:Damage-inducible protein DinB n=1 Tax=Mucilaginibacter celer TaxID=2305508 RepID=A0A494VPZ5_9SPHI|nr:DinB family protein [Mucilaginibacter celer]AYL95971.1 hypothetical protein HYN43_012030 [Mucilaginibacter celer]
MKAYFIKLFDYNKFATQQILTAMADKDTPAVTIKLMTHLLTTELVWLERCSLATPTMTTPWPEPLSIDQCKQLVSPRHQAWTSFIDELSEADFDKVIPYHSFAGDYYENQLNEIITHVINHGTHTRAQIGQQLKFAGAQTLPITDYSYYLRLLNS